MLNCMSCEPISVDLMSLKCCFGLVKNLKLSVFENNNINKFYRKVYCYVLLRSIILRKEY